MMGLPDAHARDLAETVQTQLQRALNLVGWYLSRFGRTGEESAGEILAAEREWGKANAALRELRESLHDSVGN